MRKSVFPFIHFSPCRRLLPAYTHYLRATGSKWAAPYLCETAGDHASNCGEVFAPAAGMRQCGQQPLGVWVFRAVKDIPHGALLHDFSGIKYRHTITRFSDHAHVMSDEKDGESFFLF